jgi:hypothetical protein
MSSKFSAKAIFESNLSVTSNKSDEIAVSEDDRSAEQSCLSADQK